jgi:predicted transcriptional regulator
MAPTVRNSIYSTMDGMDSMVDVSVSVAADLWNSVETAASDDCTSVSVMVQEALAQHLSRRARLRSIAPWTWEDGSEAHVDLSEPDPMLEAIGCA